LLLNVFFILEKVQFETGKMVKTIQHLYCSILLTFSSLQIVCYGNHNPHNIHITYSTMVKGYDRIELSKLLFETYMYHRGAPL